MPSPDYDDDLVFPPQKPNRIEELEAEIKQLRQLLKECMQHLQAELYNPDTGAVYTGIEKLLIKINEALK